MQKIEVILMNGKETKGTYVYEEELTEGGKPPVLKTQYIQKWALGSNQPLNATRSVTNPPSVQAFSAPLPPPPCRHFAVLPHFA